MDFPITRWWWGLLCTRPTGLVGFLVLAHWNKSADRHVSLLGHINLILSQPVCALPRYYCVFRGEATNTNVRVFRLTRSELEPTMTLLRPQWPKVYGTGDCDLTAQNNVFWLVFFWSISILLRRFIYQLLS
jgi:hypothetical protein